jgi:hypothetical protein
VSELTDLVKSIALSPFRAGRYAVRSTGPAGHSRYITRRGEESDNPEAAQTFEVSCLAHRMADGIRPIWPNCIVDVVNLDDAEDPCHED